MPQLKSMEIDSKLSDLPGWNYKDKHIGKVYELSNELASILHFDSPTFEIWYDKFSNLSNIIEKNFKQIPFKFYRDSIEIVREGDVESARAYYNKMKVDTYNKDNAITIDF